MTLPSNFDINGVIACLALIVAIYSARASSGFNKKQIKFEETAEKLNKLLITKESVEFELAKRADLSANFYKAGKNDYRLKIFNRGKGSAMNANFLVLDDCNLFMHDEIDRKFPVPIMEQHESLELHAMVHMQSPSRAHIKLTWDDEFEKGQEKELHPTW